VFEKKLPKYHIKIEILLKLHSQKVNVMERSVIFNAGVETEFKPENVAVRKPLNVLHALDEIEQQLHFCVFLTVLLRSTIDSVRSKCFDTNGELNA